MQETLAQFVQDVLEKNPVHKRFMEAALKNMTEEETRHLGEYLAFCTDSGLTIDYLSDCYMTIVMDTLQEQIYFQKNGKYRHSSFAEVADAVYFNDDYMSHYMYGLALTSFLWPNHLAMHRFFKETLPRSKTGKYLEIGPGHGYFLMEAMRLSAYTDFIGIDISETSIAQTRNLVAHFGRELQKPLQLECMDFLTADIPPAHYDAVVMGEVLEHVEKPDIFLKRIAQISKNDAWIFVTTCINTPAIDHIYLFKTPEELDILFQNCGLRAKQSLIRPYEGKTLAESLEQKLAINVAYVLEKTR